MIKATTMKGWFDSMLGDIKYSPEDRVGQLYPFFVRAGCIKRRPPRHEFFEFFIDVGLGQIDQVMQHKRIRQTDLSFVFPERWLGVAEQQAFMWTLARHPDAKKIKSVDILTSSPLLISDFMQEQIRILTWPEDEGLFDGNSNR